MTKSQQSGTRLRLSSLFRWLMVLCFIKLSILALLLLDIPMPFTSEDSGNEATKQRQTVPVAENFPNNANGTVMMADRTTQKNAPTDCEARPAQTTHGDAPALPALDPAHMPQGSEATRLAASLKPDVRRNRHPGLPAPVVINEHRQTTERPVPGLPLPAPLAAPVAEPGTPAPLVSNDTPEKEKSFWDILGLKGLPIPSIGSLKAAHAAAQSMPVPQMPSGGTRQASPFAVPEQNAPITMPGAPDIPSNIPRGQTNGAPLPPRTPATSAARRTDMPTPKLDTPQSAPRNDINSDAQDLARQQQDVLMLKKQMDDRLEDLKTSEARVKQMLKEAKALEDKKMHSLILMYGNMKPKTAAKALENLDERVAVRILQGMTPKQSGEILSYTNPTVTAKLTELLTRMRLPE
ncbi:MAG: hypothetical protein K6F46_01460 [Desulfovibrio sp.]|nr:hypothetical protein [Desulfovibrio sp.]